MKRLTAAFFLSAMSFTAIAWDGYDLETGANIEIERGNRVRSGSEIEFYDFDAG